VVCLAINPRFVGLALFPVRGNKKSVARLSHPGNRPEIYNRSARKQGVSLFADGEPESRVLHTLSSVRASGGQVAPLKLRAATFLLAAVEVWCAASRQRHGTARARPGLSLRQPEASWTDVSIRIVRPGFSEALRSHVPQKPSRGSRPRERSRAPRISCCERATGFAPKAESTSSGPGPQKGAASAITAAGLGRPGSAPAYQCRPSRCAGTEV